VRFFVVGLAVAVSCSKPDPPTLVPEKATLVRIDPQGMQWGVELAATNPNSVDLTASDVTSRIVLGNEEVGTLRVPTTTTLPAGKTTRVIVPLSVSWPGAAALARLAATSDAVPYSVDGTLEMGGALLHVGVPFHFEGSVPRDQIVRAALNSIPNPAP
jgi:hypothetical protein